jgi:hypothetical protein
MHTTDAFGYPCGCSFPGQMVLLSSELVMLQLVKEFCLFLRQEKKWWLIPLVVMLLVVALLLIFGSTPFLAPLMYTFM